MGNDLLNGGSGNDTLNGGGGHDYAFADEPGSSFSGYSITKNADGSITLTDIDSSDDSDTGTDTLINVEAIAFFDGTYVVATNTFTSNDSII